MPTHPLLSSEGLLVAQDLGLDDTMLLPRNHLCFLQFSLWTTLGLGGVCVAPKRVKPRTFQLLAFEKAVCFHGLVRPEFKVKGFCHPGLPASASGALGAGSCHPVPGPPGAAPSTSRVPVLAFVLEGLSSVRVDHLSSNCGHRTPRDPKTLPGVSEAGPPPCTSATCPTGAGEAEGRPLGVKRWALCKVWQREVILLHVLTCGEFYFFFS